MNHPRSFLFLLTLVARLHVTKKWFLQPHPDSKGCKGYIQREKYCAQNKINQHIVLLTLGLDSIFVQL